MAADQLFRLIDTVLDGSQRKILYFRDFFIAELVDVAPDKQLS